ncbi:hypothetical protein PFICI_14237 [Pestalotiopsis fici W106-1]|uniref:Xylanolytic transcriptional activator regulatory domain-containing protein n=1 Tax=Pestalotiopsis fici (strain W106-1 / CGMCC3.15140) TaxID=1229662 RepID=W3WNH9_PESFW|nr:uncharacterized protein PFICI_14237 [Pestalotiopsis fici W106-1]ETS74371.1 hypothetical protein PFICI_14237 [Pestalotiopsis fici W106-1]
MTSPQNSSNVDTPGPVLQPFSLLHPISQAAYVDNFESLLPTRRRAIQLWQTFILNVDPMFKILHIPTVQPIVYAAINEPHDVKPDLRALLFAIYFSALTSTLRDVASCLNQDHEAELERFKRGIEISLSQADFLDQPTMQALQAMAIFIAAFRRFGSGRSIWTLNGMVIRAAQLMGIHRDGKLFNLSPFDQEMRHRLWWKIISTDSRTLEDQGMWTTGNRYLGDARLPLNIDDRDMSPQTTSMPQEHIGFAESTPLLSICHIHIAGEAVAQLLLCADLESYSEKLPATQEAIDRTRAELEKKFFSNHNPHIPIQRLFSNLTKMILDKLEWQCQERLLRHKQNNGREDAKGEARNYDAESDALFIRACELLDASLELVLDEIYTSYTWHTSSYPPYELLTFILWRMYTSSTQSSTDWAWQIVLRSFASIEETSIIPDMGTRWSILCKLKEKVAGLRTHTQNNLQFVGSPDHSPPHAGLEREARQENHDADVSLEGTTSDLEDPLFSMDWTTFQQSLNMDGMSWP